MSKFYSASTRGFYDTDIHGASMPPDVVHISDDLHADLLKQQGLKEIVPDENGFPTLVDVVASTMTYAQKRHREYPSIGEQLDAIWKGGEAAAEMLAQVQAVKAKYPKG